ncbi:MAG: gliding motility-associated C-terminal domain-containing protein [Bacteroidetes bacterium]|nr:gliding motility-associated C-terminal domain-containing protein [Bacteroidota bacterium]
MIKKLLVFLFSFLSFFSWAQYCTPIVSSNNLVPVGDSIGIVNFQLGSINNSSPAKMGYENYSHLSTKLKKGGTYTLSVTVPSVNGQEIMAWIDYDQNQIINSFSNDFVGYDFGNPYTPQPITFKVPYTAKTGTTKLRVASNEDFFSLLFSDVCNDIINGDVEDYTVDLEDSIYIEAFQYRGTCVHPGTADQTILRIAVYSTDTLNTNTATSFVLNTNGSTNATNDILSANLWYTGTSEQFQCASKTLFGTSLAPSGMFVINGNQPLAKAGVVNYFWLTYDISANATLGNKIDAECLNGMIGGNLLPCENPSPNGNRPVSKKSNYTFPQANYWNYGVNEQGIDFNCDPPCSFNNLNSSHQAFAGSSSISDKNGNMLFYTDGSYVFDKCHNEMPGGLITNSQLSNSGKSPAIIIPNPGNPHKYYIFQNPNTFTYSYFLYSEVDLSLNGGLGSITNKLAVLDSTVSEHAMAAINHCNGKDFWIVIKDFNAQTFKSYLITANGISNPVLSSLNWGMDNEWDGVVGNTIARTSLKISPNGKKIAFGADIKYTPNQNFGSKLVLFDFDNSTGIVSNPNVLNNSIILSDITFSNNSSVLYAANTFWGTTLYQYNLCLSTYPSNTFNTSMYLYRMQNSPNGKIYFNRADTSVYFPVINNPNQFGLVGNFIPKSTLFSAESTIDFASLTRPFNESYFNTAIFTATNTGFTSTTVCFGDTTSFTDTSSVFPGCSPQTRSYYWDFGDPASGAANNSFLQHPKHKFSASGIFTVTQYLQEGCQYDTIVKTITVHALPNVSILGNDSICAGKNLTLTASGGTDFLWSNGNTTNNISISPTSNTNYSVTITDNNNCSDTSSISITVINNPTASITSPTTSICSGTSISLTASGGTLYNWSNGITTAQQSNSPLTNTVYTVTVSNGFCSDTASISISVAPSPTVSISGNTSICSGENTTLSASSNGSYLWSNGSISSTITVSPISSTTFSLVAALGNCYDTANVSITVNQTPILSATGDVICTGEQAVISASGANSYSWSNNNTSDSQTISPTSTSSYTVIGSNGNCKDTSVVIITVNQLPTLTASNDTTINEGETVQLAAAGGVIYTWSPNENITCISCPNPQVNPTQSITYFVEAQNAFGCKSIESILITVNQLESSLYIPNAFSPNGDGSNEIFMPLFNPNEFTNYELFIYNSWGQLLFETTNKSLGWDGTYKNKPLRTDVYTYVLRITDKDGIKRKFLGNISLLK